MKNAAKVAAILLAFAALFAAREGVSATCTGCSLSGVSLEVDTTPDRILIVGDPQPGSNCARWGAVPDDAEDQACGAAQVARMVWLIEDAFSRYAIDAAIVEGDLVDTTQTWELTAFSAGIASLSDAIKSKLYFVNGNHDANDTNCTTMWRSVSTAIDGTGSVLPLGDRIPLWWSARLRRTRLVGIQSTLITMRASTACQAQNRAGKFPGSTAGYAAAACFGDASLAVGASANGVTCTVDGDCQSGQCGTWEDYYEPTMTFLRDEIHTFKGFAREEALVLNMHQALCRPTAAASCDFTAGGGGFANTHNLKQCGAGSTTPGAYCDNENSAHYCINTVSGLPSFADCVDGTDDRPGFETRDRFLDLVQQIPASAALDKSLIQATGHVGSTVADQAEAYYPGSSFSNAQFSHNKDILGTGLPFLVAELPGPYTPGHHANVPQAAIVEVRHNQPPTIVEYTNAPNSAPVLDEVGTAGEITLASGTDQYVFTGTDPDYQDLDYYIDTSSTPALDACLDLDQKNTTSGSGDLDANLDATACAAGRYPSSGEYTICITDGLLTGGLPTGDGLSSCEPFHVVVPSGGASLWDTMVWGTDVWG